MATIPAFGPGHRGRNLVQRFVCVLATLMLSFAHTVYAAEGGRHLRIGMGADVTSIDPHFLNIAPNNAVGWHVYDALVNVDADTRLIPGLATSWRVIDDATWEFTLRKGVRFHDGSPFDARDVAFSIQRAGNLAGKGGQFGSFVRAIANVEIVDPHTIRFKTSRPHAVLPRDLNSIFIVPRAIGSAGTDDFNTGRAVIGTGPFKLQSFARSDRVELVRYENYWGDKPDWDRVTLRILPQDAGRLAALLANDVDAIENVPTSDIARLTRDKRLRIERKVSWRTLFLHLDQYRDSPPGMTDHAGKPLARNPLRDARVREALSVAIDRKAIVERLMESMALPASNLVAPPVFAHDSSIPVTEHDPQRARKLLAEAGYPKGFRLTLSAPNNRYVNDEKIAQAIAQMWARIGIAPVRVDTMPAATYFTKARNGEFAVALLGWGSSAGDLALRSLLTTPSAEKGMGTWNWGRYSNPRVDALIEQSLATVEQSKREALAREAMGIVVKDHAAIVLHHQYASWAMRADLRYPGRTDEYTLAQGFR